MSTARGHGVVFVGRSVGAFLGGGSCDLPGIDRLTGRLHHRPYRMSGPVGIDKREVWRGHVTELKLGKRRHVTMLTTESCRIAQAASIRR